MAPRGESRRKGGQQRRAAGRLFPDEAVDAMHTDLWRGTRGTRPPRSCALGSGCGWRLRLLVPLLPRVYFGVNDLAKNGFGISECRELSLRHSESRDVRQPGFV